MPNSGIDPKLLSRPSILHNTPRIIKDNVITQLSTTNGSTMSGHNIGSVSTSNLVVPRFFNVPNLSYNLFSMGQLAVRILRGCGAGLSSENKDK